MATDRNPELRQAWDFVEHTGKSIFLTGKAGTGKTTFLRTVVEKSTKQMVVVAPTGVAAINAGGVTIHSFFQLPLSPYVPGAKVKNVFDFGKEKRKILSSLDLLIIDEISMVRSDLLDAIDSVLRRYRDRYQPFGGVQLLMIGDLAQLTPVVTPEDEEMLRPYYDTPYFFGSKALQQVDYVTIQLEKIYRQADATFVDILNHIRDGRPTDEDMRQLHTRYNPQFVPKPEEGYIRLTTHNRMADFYNENEMRRLTTPAFTYMAETKGNFPELSYPTAHQLVLKVGAQVMFIKNDTAGEYYNGKIGRVVELERERVRVVCTGEDHVIDVTPQEWENAKYMINPETHEIVTDVQGVFRQYPLRLAWAITIHKSQGLTFERAIIDAGHSFAPGQVYVALSRCRHLDGIVIASQITSAAIINDDRVDRYIERQEAEAERSVALLPQLKQDYFRQLMMELFNFSNLQIKEDYVLRLMQEFFSMSNASLTQLHRQTALDLKTKVTDVARKWKGSLAMMSYDDLHSDALLERVKRSAQYFIDNMKLILERPLELSKKIQSNNKNAMQRFNDAYMELLHLYRFHLLLLQFVAANGFTVTSYLKEKQRSMVLAMEQDKRKTAKAKKKEQAKKEEEKEKTYVTSYKMFLQGMTLDDIALSRQLTVSTIISHLGRYVETGQIPLEDLVSNEHIRAIRQAVSLVGASEGKAAIKAQCPEDISYQEIDLVLRTVK